MAVGLKHWKIFLLCDLRNPLWHEKHQGPPEQLRRDLNIDRANMSNWRHGKAISQKKLNELCKTVADKASLPCPPDILAHWINDERLDIFEFARQFNISRMDCQQFLDEATRPKLPLISAFCYGKGRYRDSAYASKHLLPLYRGTYHAYRFRYSTMGRILVVSMLQVRYLMQISEHPSLWAICCKMHVPRVLETASGTRSAYYEYDGYVCEKMSHAYWIFEQRAGRDASDDLLYMISDRRKDDDACLIGDCLTTCGVMEQQQRVVERIVLKRISCGNDEEEAMMNKPYIINNESAWSMEYADIVSLLTSSSTHAQFFTV